MRQREDLMMPRPVGDSQSEMNEIVLPNDTNPLGALLGGRLMHWIATMSSPLPSIISIFGLLSMSAIW